MEKPGPKTRKQRREELEKKAKERYIKNAHRYIFMGDKGDITL